MSSYLYFYIYVDIARSVTSHNVMVTVLRVSLVHVCVSVGCAEHVCVLVCVCCVCVCACKCVFMCVCSAVTKIPSLIFSAEDPSVWAWTHLLVSLASDSLASRASSCLGLLGSPSRTLCVYVCLCCVCMCACVVCVCVLVLCAYVFLCCVCMCACVVCVCVLVLCVYVCLCCVRMCSCVVCVCVLVLCVYVCLCCVCMCACTCGKSCLA